MEQTFKMNLKYILNFLQDHSLIDGYSIHKDEIVIYFKEDAPEFLNELSGKTIDTVINNGIGKIEQKKKG